MSFNRWIRGLTGALAATLLLYTTAPAAQITQASYNLPKIEAKKNLDDDANSSNNFKSTASYVLGRTSLDMGNGQVITCMDNLGCLFNLNLFGTPPFIHGFKLLYYNSECNALDEKNKEFISNWTLTSTGYSLSYTRQSGNWRFFLSTGIDLYYGMTNPGAYTSTDFYGTSMSSQARAIHMLGDRWGANVGVLYTKPLFTHSYKPSIMALTLGLAF